MAGDFQGFALEKAEQLFGRLRELLSSGQAYILTRFGVDLGLEPDLSPTWIVLSASAVLLLLLLVAASRAAVRGAPLLGRTPTPRVELRGCEPDGPGSAKPARAEEQRKRNKKKPLEKKTQSNGQPANAAQQEVTPTGAVLKIKEDKKPVQLKKKKSKTDVKPAPHIITNDWKEDEGAWETKVSNREKKKQQRLKDKGPEDPGSPGGTPVVVVAAKKNRGSNESRGPGKNNPASRAASSNWRDEPSVDGGGWTDVPVKAAGRTGGGRSSVHAAPHSGVKRPSSAQETQAAAWSSGEGRKKAGPNPASFSAPGCDAAEPPANSTEQQRAGCGEANDDWSGFARAAPADPSSDWYAPVEHWGNYEGVAETAAPPAKQEPLPSKVSGSGDNREDLSDGAARAKKRRRRKKNTEEEDAPDAQAVRLSSAPAGVPAPAAGKQNPSISSSQRGPQPPKPSQKKKACREI